MEPTTTSVVVFPGPGQLLLGALIVGAGVAAGAAIVNFGVDKAHEALNTAQFQEQMKQLQLLEQQRLMLENINLAASAFGVIAPMYAKQFMPQAAEQVAEQVAEQAPAEAVL